MPILCSLLLFLPLMIMIVTWHQTLMMFCLLLLPSRGDERWGGLPSLLSYGSCWAWHSACLDNPPIRGGEEAGNGGFPFLPWHLQERPEGRGRRWDPSAKGPCHPWHPPVPWSQRARGGAGQHRRCPVRQVWQWEDDCGCRQRFFSGWCSFLKERMGRLPPCLSHLNLGELFPALSHFWTLEIWYCFLSWMVSLPLGCESHPVPVVLSEGGSRSLCVNILLLNFQGQQTQFWGCWEMVGWERR